MFTYYSPDYTPYRVLWGGSDEYHPNGVHNALAEIAGKKMGLNSIKTRILNTHSKDPDTWGLEQMIEHYLDGSPYYSNAPDNCRYYANEAKRQLQADINSESGWRCLS